MLQDNEKRQIILEAATQLIITHGIENTSLGDIAVEAGISKGTLYYYYPSKTDLIFDVAELHMARVTTYLTEWVDTSTIGMTPAEVLRNVFETILQANLRAKLHLFLVQEAIRTDPELRARFREKYVQWKGMIQERLGSVLGPDADHAAMASTIMAIIDGLLIQNMIGMEDLQLQKICDLVTLGTDHIRDTGSGKW